MKRATPIVPPHTPAPTLRSRLKACGRSAWLPPLCHHSPTASPDPSLATPGPYLQGTAVPSRPAGSPARPLVPGSTEVPRPGLPRVLVRPGGLFRRPQTRIPPRPSLMDSTGCPQSRAPRRYPPPGIPRRPPSRGRPRLSIPVSPVVSCSGLPPWPVGPRATLWPPTRANTAPPSARRASPVAPRPADSPAARTPGLHRGLPIRPPPPWPRAGLPRRPPYRAPPRLSLPVSTVEYCSGLTRGGSARVTTRGSETRSTRAPPSRSPASPPRPMMG